MKQQDYNSSITVSAPPKDAFDKIARVSEWWTNNLEGSSKNLNDVFTVRFGKTFVTIKLIEVIKNKKIVWHVEDCYLDWINNKTEWKDTEMNFEILPDHTSTNINFTHVGLKPGIECYNDCRRGWDQYIQQSMYNLITKNEGMPDKF